MVLITKIEIKVRKETESNQEEEGWDNLTKRVMRDINGSDDEDSFYPKDLWESKIADAIIDFDKMLLFYEYEGYTFVEQVTDQPLTLAHGIEPVQRLFYDVQAADEEEIEDPYTLEEIDNFINYWKSEKKKVNKNLTISWNNIFARLNIFSYICSTINKKKIKSCSNEGMEAGT